MIAFSKFQHLSPNEKEQVIKESCEVDLTNGNFGQLIKDIVNATNSSLFASALKRFKEHTESLKWKS